MMADSLELVPQSHTDTSCVKCFFMSKNEGCVRPSSLPSCISERGGKVLFSIYKKKEREEDESR